MPSHFYSQINHLDTLNPTNVERSPILAWTAFIAVGPGAALGPCGRRMAKGTGEGCIIFSLLRIEYRTIMREPRLTLKCT